MILKNSKTGWVFPSPSSFKMNINDIDLDSYRSPVTAELIDKSLALGMVGLTVGWDYLTEEQAEEIMAQTWDNPMPLTIKAPILEPIIAPIYTNIYHQCSAKVKYPAAAITDNEPSNTDQPYSILSQLLSVQYFSASSSL